MRSERGCLPAPKLVSRPRDLVRGFSCEFCAPLLARACTSCQFYETPRGRRERAIPVDQSDRAGHRGIGLDHDAAEAPTDLCQGTGQHPRAGAGDDQREQCLTLCRLHDDTGRPSRRREGLIE